jgi:hypothetical protein
MRIHRIGLLGWLLASLVVTDAAAQSRPRAADVQSLALAENTLIDALARRDRAAFQKVLTAESVFFFPRMSEGPDAIVASWLPFLIEQGPTLVITSDGVSLTGPNLGASTGTFAISGQTDEGTQTIRQARWRSRGVVSARRGRSRRSTGPRTAPCACRPPAVLADIASA